MVNCFFWRPYNWSYNPTLYITGFPGPTLVMMGTCWLFLTYSFDINQGCAAFWKSTKVLLLRAVRYERRASFHCMLLEEKKNCRFSNTSRWRNLGQRPAYLWLSFYANLNSYAENLWLQLAREATERVHNLDQQSNNSDLFNELHTLTLYSSTPRLT